MAGSRGALFAVYHPPAAGMASCGGVLYAPPFAEELNKSRRMIAQQARRLAAAGFGVLIQPSQRVAPGDQSGQKRHTQRDDDGKAGGNGLKGSGVGQAVIFGTERVPILEKCD